MGSQRATALCNQVGVGQVVLVSSINKGVDTVVDILLNRLVDRRLARWRACAVVVDTQSTTAVHKVYVVAHFVQLHIEL